ncbi:AzlC family ABC transporter permease [Pararhodospirillum oryzae]|uniref:Branched-chain amino acid ABC transporter permease n=1 Tax=Pararhodospirillum oryzae TaxID=478448 RepID=A0A512H3H1_9PROT|nr:AzlC family ABC transporter permease [Pararhodospirillum oryzae]GEO79958.1 hypothetical protein ROR02_00890 [Pararhodospirillum oryzae]
MADAGEHPPLSPARGEPGPGASFGAGLRAAAPIMIGYAPVAIAFGAAGQAAGLGAPEVIATSAVVYSGASQFLMLTALGSGTALPAVAALCIALNLRHLLYGPLVMARLPAAAAVRFLYAFSLTDEVFASTLARSGGGTLPARWLLGLGAGAYGAWVAGTALGVFVGDALAREAPAAAAATGFALPALFLALAWLNVTRATVAPMLAAAAASVPFAVVGRSGLALLAGGLAGVVVAWAQRRFFRKRRASPQGAGEGRTRP